MKVGEKCILRCRSDYAYGDSGSPPKIPGGATLNFEVELFGWEEIQKEPYEMDIDEKVAAATKCKEAGTVAFKAGDFKVAAAKYSGGFKYVWDNIYSDEVRRHLHCRWHRAHGRRRRRTRPRPRRFVSRSRSTPLPPRCASTPRPRGHGPCATPDRAHCSSKQAPTATPSRAATKCWVRTPATSRR